MHRLRLLLAISTLGVVTVAAPAFAQDEAPVDEPAVVLDDGAEAPEEEAWTFRYLVPTLLLMTGVAVVLVSLAYGVRVRGRYRVTQ